MYNTSEKLIFSRPIGYCYLRQPLQNVLRIASLSAVALVRCRLCRKLCWFHVDCKHF